MNILVLNYEYPPIGGGGAPVSKDLAEAYSKNGDNVTVLTMRYGDLPQQSVENGVTVYRLNCRRSQQFACSPLEQYSYLRAVKKFMKAHPELQRYDVCHTHFVIPTGQAALDNKQRYGIPYIITAHGSDVEGHNSNKKYVVLHALLRIRWRKIADGSCFIISPSEHILQLLNHNYPLGKYIYIPNGIDYELYHSLNIQKDKDHRIIIMGRIQKFKNVQFIIEALSRIKREKGLGDWGIDIVGDGPYRTELEKLVKLRGLDESTHFYGWIDNKSEKLNNLLKKASIFVSASNFENCPMSVVEATIAGCYPLVSDIPAHRQMLADKFRFTIENDDELVAKLIDAMNMVDRSENIPDMSRFDIKRVSDEYRKILEKCQKQI